MAFEIIVNNMIYKILDILLTSALFLVLSWAVRYSYQFEAAAVGICLYSLGNLRIGRCNHSWHIIDDEYHVEYQCCICGKRKIISHFEWLKGKRIK